METSAKAKDGLSGLFETSARASITKELGNYPEDGKSGFFRKKGFFFRNKKSLAPTLLVTSAHQKPVKKRDCSIM